MDSFLTISIQRGKCEPTVHNVSSSSNLPTETRWAVSPGKLQKTLLCHWHAVCSLPKALCHLALYVLIMAHPIIQQPMKRAGIRDQWISPFFSFWKQICSQPSCSSSSSFAIYRSFTIWGNANSHTGIMSGGRQTGMLRRCKLTAWRRCATLKMSLKQ